MSASDNVKRRAKETGHWVTGETGEVVHKIQETGKTITEKARGYIPGMGGEKKHEPEKTSRPVLDRIDDLEEKCRDLRGSLSPSQMEQSPAPPSTGNLSVLERLEILEKEYKKLKDAAEQKTKREEEKERERPEKETREDYVKGATLEKEMEKHIPAKEAEAPAPPEQKVEEGAKVEKGKDEKPEKEKEKKKAEKDKRRPKYHRKYTSCFGIRG